MLEHGVACILVHHKSYSTVGGSVDLIAADGVDRSNILVVDNSEEPARRDEFESSVAGSGVLYTQNGGYGAAVNAGLAHLSSSGRLPEYVLVATHEVRPQFGTLSSLMEILRRDGSVAAAGPTLLVGPEGNVRVWSCGGGRTDRLHAHVHVVPPLPLADLVRMPPRERLWLDGAFVLYRASVLATMRFDERYFLYMEETDLHYRMRAEGFKCIWVPAGVVWQSTGLTPPYYYARNAKLFFRRNEDPLRALLAPTVLVGRDIFRRLRQGDVLGAREAARGYLTPVR